MELSRPERRTVQFHVLGYLCIDHLTWILKFPLFKCLLSFYLGCTVPTGVSDDDKKLLVGRITKTLGKPSGFPVVPRAKVPSINVPCLRRSVYCPHQAQKEPDCF